MSLDAQLGACLAVGIPGPDATEEVLASLRRLQTQTLIVFERNFRDPEQFTTLISRLEEGLQRRLLVLVDHEGGRVVRFRSGVTRFPPARTAGAAQAVGDIARQGATEAEELKRLGVRVNLAPCVDVAVEAADPVIGDRSYGPDPARVSALGAARIRGLQSHGVAACAKHFPGLGAVPRDPHVALPTIGLDWTAMEEIHLPPFDASIAAGVAMVMSSHVCYPGLGDPAGLPATYSGHLIRGLLRDRLGFSGVVLTDDLGMGAVRSLGTLGEAAVRADAAGHDLLLICSDLDGAEEALAALRRAYEDGRLERAELSASVGRLTAMRRKFLG